MAVFGQTLIQSSRKMFSDLSEANECYFINSCYAKYQ
jgi:hypothetical protein